MAEPTDVHSRPYGPGESIDTTSPQGLSSLPPAPPMPASPNEALSFDEGFVAAPGPTTPSFSSGLPTRRDRWGWSPRLIVLLSILGALVIGVGIWFIFLRSAPRIVTAEDVGEHSVPQPRGPWAIASFNVPTPLDGRFRTGEASYEYPTSWRQLDPSTVHPELPVRGLRWASETGFGDPWNFSVLATYKYPHGEGQDSAHRLSVSILEGLRRKVPSWHVRGPMREESFHGLPAFRSTLVGKRGPLVARIELLGVYASDTYYLYECSMAGGGRDFSFASGCDMVMSTLHVAGQSPTAAGYGPSTPQAAVREYFRADARHDHVALRKLSTGPVRTLWTWMDAEPGPCGCPPERITIAGLHIVRQSKTESLLSLEALSSNGTVFSGPLLAERVDGQWLVADYFRNGRSVRASIMLGVGGSQTRGPLQISVLGLYTPGGTGDLWVRVSNGSRDEVQAANLSVTSETGTDEALRSWTFSQDSNRIPEKSSIVTDLGWVPTEPFQPGQKLVVHPTFEDMLTGERQTFDLHITIPGSPV